MATQTLPFSASAGVTPTQVKVFASRASDTVVGTSTGVTQQPNQVAGWLAAFTDLATGTYYAIGYAGATPVVEWYVTTLAVTGTYNPIDELLLYVIVDGIGGDATLAKQNEILAKIGAAAIVRVPVVRPGYVEVIEGDTYDGTLTAKVYWTTTTDYTTADSISLTVWRPNADGTRTTMKTVAGVATTATNVEIADLVATFDAALVFAGKPMQERLQFAVVAVVGSDEYTIDSGDWVVLERR